MIPHGTYKRMVLQLLLVFKYNENDIETAREMAKKHDMIFEVQKSSRFFEEDDLKPTNEQDYLKRKNYGNHISKM